MQKKPDPDSVNVDTTPGLVIAAGYRIEVAPALRASFGGAMCVSVTVHSGIPQEATEGTERAYQARSNRTRNELPTDGDFADILVSGPSGQRIVRAPASCARAIGLLGAEVVSEQTMLDCISGQPGGDAKTALCSMLEQFAHAGALRRVVAGGHETIADVEPLGEHYRFRFAVAPTPDQSLCLSRFCLLRSERGSAVLESPLSHARVWLFEPALAAVVASFTSARSGSSAAARNYGISEARLESLLSLLIAERFLEVCEPGSKMRREPLPLQHWEFHDLLFHSRSRRGRHGGVAGASFRFRNKTKPSPGTKPPMSAHPIALPRPDMQALFLQDLPLTAALELRASIREPVHQPITFTDLGHFLYRSARVRNRTAHQGVEFTSRPYPSGGASYELEIYPIVDRCVGLLSGAYHYEPLTHALEPLVQANPSTEALIQHAYAANAGTVRPNILLVICARFQRVSWKYESIAYATILKDVGVLYQTMYLVATAMRLAPCAIGAGDSDLSCLLLGQDYYEEGAVGEFMLGSRPGA